MNMQEKDFNYYYGTKITQFSFYKLPRALFKDDYFKDISSDAKLLYALMLDRVSLSMKNGWVDVQGRVYIIYKLEDIMEELGCSKPTGIKVVRELDNIGLIEKVHSGGGKPDIIYVKNLSNSDDEQKEEATEKVKPEIKIDNVVLEQQIDISKTTKNFTLEGQKNSLQEVKNFDLEGQKNSPQEVKKVDPNYTNTNYTQIYTDSIYQSIEKDGIDGVDNTVTYRDLIRKNLDYDYYVQYGKDVDLFLEIYEIICDIVCVDRVKVRINSEDYPYQLVKSCFLKLNSSHVEYVMECMKTNITKIVNIRAYLLTALYNAPLTMNNYYQQEARYDMYVAM